jgi:hypothetical protein
VTDARSSRRTDSLFGTLTTVTDVACSKYSGSGCSEERDAA